MLKPAHNTTYASPRANQGGRNEARTRPDTDVKATLPRRKSDTDYLAAPSTQTRHRINPDTTDTDIADTARRPTR